MPARKPHGDVGIRAQLLATAERLIPLYASFAEVNGDDRASDENFALIRLLNAGEPVRVGAMDLQDAVYAATGQLIKFPAVAYIVEEDGMWKEVNE
jgi:hypothetical protein